MSTRVTRAQLVVFYLVTDDEMMTYKFLSFIGILLGVVPYASVEISIAMCFFPESFDMKKDEKLLIELARLGSPVELEIIGTLNKTVL